MSHIADEAYLGRCVVAALEFADKHSASPDTIVEEVAKISKVEAASALQEEALQIVQRTLVQALDLIEREK